MIPKVSLDDHVTVAAELTFPSKFKYINRHLRHEFYSILVLNHFPLTNTNLGLSNEYTLSLWEGPEYNPHKSLNILLGRGEELKV